MINRIDRYVLKQVAVPLITALGIGLMMLLAERLTRLIDFTLGKRNSVGVVFEMLAYLVPHYLGTAIPAALFLGLVFGFNKMSKSHELDAMFALGVSLNRLVRPIILLSVLFSVAALFVFGWLQPYTRYAYRSLVFDVGSIDAFYLAEEGVFMQSGSRTFIIDKLNRADSSFERVFIFDYNGPNGAETLTAAHGKLVTVPGQRRPILRLNNGDRFEVERWPTLEASLDGVPHSKSSFDYSDTPLGKLSNKVFRERGEDQRELSLTEIYRLRNTPPEGATLASMAAEFHRRLVYVVMMLLLPFLAIPFTISRPRSPRALRITLAMISLVVFYEIIEQGAVAVSSSGYSPWLFLWLPTFLVAAFSFIRFYRTSSTVGGGGLDDALGSVQDFLNAVVRPLKKLIWREVKT